MKNPQSSINTQYGTQRGYVRHALALLEHYFATSRKFRDPDFNRVQRLVFVCLGNICRSAYAHHYATQAISFPIASFGLSTSTNSPCNPVAQKVAAARGIDMSGHLTTDMSDFEIISGDLLLVMELRQARRLQPLIANLKDVQVSLLGNWSRPMRPHIHDPHTLSEAYFDTCFEVIESSIDRLYKELISARQSAVLPL